MVKQDNTVRFKDGGGTIRNRKTGRIVRFYEHEGAYFIKLKVTDPEQLNISPVDPASHQPMDFHRRGR